MTHAHVPWTIRTSAGGTSTEEHGGHVSHQRFGDDGHICGHSTSVRLAALIELDLDAPPKQRNPIFNQELSPMNQLSQVLRPLTVLGLVAFMTGGSPTTARGAEHKTNACGCYQTTAGECICTKKGPCDCPGECEPKGCDEKRQKALEKEVKEETKKAEAAEKKRQQEAAEKQRQAEEQAAAAEDSETTDDSANPQKDGEGEKGDKAKAKVKGKKAKNSEKPRARASAAGA